MDSLMKAADRLYKAKKILVLTGAGMSTESGLKDFRSKNGLASTLYQGYTPEEILSSRFFYEETDLFYTYLQEKLNASGISPNKGHRILADWEKKKDLSIITQNIDMLHQRAGSTRVLEIHGTLGTATCTRCGEKKDMREVYKSGHHCLCGGLYKPDIVLYDEEVKGIHKALQWTQEADLLLVLGTSLRVYPAASIPEVFGQGSGQMIIINRDETPYAHDYRVLEIHESIGSTLEKLNKIWITLEKMEKSGESQE